MVEASAKAHIVATIIPNSWSMIHADLQISNTGNATAYDIRISFNPALQIDPNRPERAVPLQYISVLKPGEGLSSYLSEIKFYLQKKYEVTISWKHNPSINKRVSNVYILDMAELDGIVKLGASEPLLQIAQDIRKIRDDWTSVATGWRKVQVDVHTAADRQAERRQIDPDGKEHTRRAPRSVSKTPRPKAEQLPDQ